MTFVRRAAIAAAIAFAPVAGAEEPVLAHANGILVEDGYAHAAFPSAPTGAAYMRITNESEADDRLLKVRTEAADRAALHGHEMQDGIARMRPAAGGIEIPAHATVVLETGGLHVMLMGLAAPLQDGGSVAMTLVFERAGEIPVTLPVDLGRGRGGTAGGHAHGGG
jgi:copper(I)-binding protein